MSFGIALPSWIVEKENSVLVLGLYALVFMIALPVAVGIWWYRSVKFGGDQVLLDTTQLYYYFIHKTPYMILKKVLMVLAASLEFEKSHNSEITERPSDNIEVPQLIKELPNLGEKNKERPLCYGYSIKARALLHAHLGRIKLPPNTLEIDKLYIIKKCPYLLQEFVQCVSQLTMLALAGRIARTPNLDTLENAMKLSPLIVQALWESKNSLMQLPHINDDLLRHFTNRKRNVRSVKQLASMKNDDRRSMLRSLSDEQYEDVIKVLGKLPLIDIETRVEVLDDEDTKNITAGAIVTVTVIMSRQNMSTLFDKEHIEQEVEKEDEVESTELNEDLPNGTMKHQESPNVRKPKVWEKQNKGKKKGGKNAKNKKKPLPMNKKKMQGANQAGEKPDKNKAETTPKAAHNKSAKDSEDENSDVESDTESQKSSLSDNDEKVKDDDVSDHEDEEWSSFQQKVAKKEKVLETKSKQSHSVHCPYFPEDKQEYWWIYIADRKKHALITVPYLMTNLVDKEEVELKFTAPLKQGFYTYTVIVRSDSYVDFDLYETIKVGFCILEYFSMKTSLFLKHYFSNIA